MAWVLPLSGVSIDVFRTIVLSLVLTLATGGSAALFCGVSCHSSKGMTGECEHRAGTTAPGIVANNDCTITGNTVVFVREDGRRPTLSPDAEGTPVIPRLAFTAPTAGTLSTYPPGSRLLLELRPLLLSLRI